MTIFADFRSFLINGILMFATLLLTLGIAEFSWRWLDPLETGDLSQVYHPELYATDPPLTEWKIRHREFATHMKTNSSGFRGREFPKSADELTKPTILFIGDSFVEAMQVEEKDRFPDLTGKILGGGSVNVFSLGLSSIDPIQELQQYRVLWRDLRPDIVVHAIFIENDVLVPREDFELKETTAGLTVETITPSPPPAAHRFVDGSEYTVVSASRCITCSEILFRRRKWAVRRRREGKSCIIG